MLKQDDPRKCSAAKLVKFGLAKPVTRTASRTLILNPFSKKILLKSDKKFVNSKSNKLFLFQKQVDIAKKRLEHLEQSNQPQNLFVSDKEYTQLGYAYFLKGEYKNALQYFNKALQIQIKRRGEINIPVAMSYVNIGASFKGLGQYKEALNNSQYAIDILSKLGVDKNNLLSATAYNTISETYREQEQYTKALKYAKQALSILQNVAKSDDPRVATTYNNIGLIIYAYYIDE